MKKFLPFIIFIIAFAAVLAGQVGYKMFFAEHPAVKYNNEYQGYENLFLHASYKDVQGRPVEMTKISSPVVIYNFWASWCIPCLSEMPSMIELKNKFQPDQITIIAINTDEDDHMNAIQKTMKKINMKDEFIVVPDKAAKIVIDFKISAIPVTIVFNRGKVVEFSNGPMDFSSVEFVEKIKEWIKN
ncbi:MAG: TlpA family protein disulfide reductase [Bacteriovorax sp.]|nr:TlpA family protein disulfide reductase [Bacteriovorax sp.]